MNQPAVGAEGETVRVRGPPTNRTLANTNYSKPLAKGTLPKSNLPNMCPPEKKSPSRLLIRRNSTLARYKNYSER